MDDQNKNLLLATVLSGLVILVWYGFVAPPEPEAPPTPATQAEIVPEADAPAQVETAATAPTIAPPVETERVDIATPSLSGSIALTGARLDDLQLISYRETLSDDSPNVRLLSPVGSDSPYYALFGWIPVEGETETPGLETEWEIEAGERLEPGAPLLLRWENASGLVFRREIAVDDKYMFTITQTVENNSDSPVTLAPYGLVAREGNPDLVNFFILHEGVVRMTDGTLSEIDYDDIAGLSADESKVAAQESGWIGFTDKYWMAALIPAEGSPFSARARHVQNIYRAETILEPITIAPGATAENSERLFAGAKEWATIRDYQNESSVSGFLDSIDWGWFFFLTKPIFRLLHNLNELIGNMGWSIIALTFLLKLILFPLAYRSYASMARMRELQPQMEKLKEQAGDDREKLQKGMMELYKTNKVNPAAGCLPMLLQIPIFFSLYKVIFVTIELRHAPWIGWIRDLSVPDPSSILNFFGMAPWGIPEAGSILAFISLGILPILLGISMFLQQKLNPAPTDPTQRMVFAWMPWVFMFMLGNFASGLVLYWITNNTITFIQQYLIMRQHGVKADLLGNILGRNTPDSEKK